ncbi:MAG TPA: O-antigen ligase family protein [Pyrinomonadaceae bacterium]|nr:O-antigen ligase family protein [Pyrinomonadaceae bacterium]
MSKFYIPLAFYLAAMILSAVFSEDPKQSFIKLLGGFYLIGLAVLAFNLVRTTEEAKKAVFFWLAATLISCLVSVISLLLFYADRSNPLLFYTLSHYGTLPPGNYARIRGTFLNPNMLCNYLNVSIMFSIAAFWLGWIGKKFFLVFLLFFSIAAFFTLSPGLGGIALSLSLWFWLVFSEKRKFFLARTSLFSGISIAFIFFLMLLIMPNENPLSPYRINLPFFANEIYPSERLLAWQGTLETLWQNPLFGRGLGLDVVWIKSIIASGQTHIVTDAHQLWLNVAGQMGFLGLAAIIFLSIFFFLRARPFKFENNPITILRISFGLAFVGAFLYQGLGGSFEDARHLWILIGLLGGFSENREAFENKL